MKIAPVLLSAFFVFCFCICNAQTVQREFVFRKGENYQKRTYLNSTVIIQRGKQTLNITSSTSVYKDYKVIDVSDTAYTFDIGIHKMDVSIKAAGKKLEFDSEKPVDTTSKIARALHFMVGKGSNVMINKKGAILTDDYFLYRLANDSLLTFAGIQPETFNKGAQFNITPDFQLQPYMKKGYKWTDTLTFSRQKMKTRFRIDRITPTSTIIKFKSSVVGDLINSNSTGTYIVDNKTGVLVQRLIESVSTGYQVMGGAVYSTTRRISLSEDCVKKEDDMTTHLSR